MHLDTRECASTSFLFNQHKINANKKKPSAFRQRALPRGTTFVHQLYTAGLRSGQMLSNQRFVNGNRA